MAFVQQSNGYFYDASTGAWAADATGTPVSGYRAPTATPGQTTPSTGLASNGGAGPTTYQDASGQWFAINSAGTYVPVSAAQASQASASGAPLSTDGFHGTLTTTQDHPTLTGAENAVGIVDPLVPTAVDAAKSVAGAVSGGLGSAGTLPQGDRDALQASIANTNNYSQFYGTSLVNYSPTAAPVAQSPAAIQAAIAQQGAPIQAGTATATNATPAQIQSTALAQQQAQIQAQQVQAAQIAQTIQAQQQAPITTQHITAPQLAPSATASPYDVARTTLGTTAQAGLTQIGKPALASPTQLAGAAQIDPTQQAQFRNQQQGLAGSLQGTINGTTPSVAALMLRNATDNNVANQYALAQAATGMNTGQAQRMAAINSAQINQQSIYQQALLRAQEIATAQGQLGGVLNEGRGADLSLATNQAGLTQQAALANQSADVQTKLANAGFTNTANMTQAQLDQAIKLANAGFINTANTTQAQLDAAAAQANAQAQNSASQFNANSFNQQQQAQAQLTQGANLANQSTGLAAGTTNATLAQQVALANAAAGNTTNQQNATLAQNASLANQSANLAAGTTNATLAQQVALANASATNATNTANAGYTQAANLQNSQLGTQVSLDNANNTTSANTASAQLANAVNLANAQNQTQANLTTGQLQTQTNLANANNAVSTNALNQKAVNDLASNQLTASGQNVTAANNQAQADVGLASAAAQAKGAELNAAATGIAGLAKLSDRREKEDISESEKEIAAFMSSFRPYGWKYKRPDLPGAGKGRQYGVMAQDLEKTKVGRTLVRQRPDGRREVDVAGAATVALAAISALNRRIDRAEARR